MPPIPFVTPCFPRNCAGLDFESNPPGVLILWKQESGVLPTPGKTAHEDSLSPSPSYFRAPRVSQSPIAVTLNKECIADPYESMQAARDPGPMREPFSRASITSSFKASDSYQESLQNLSIALPYINIFIMVNSIAYISRARCVAEKSLENIDVKATL